VNLERQAFRSLCPRFRKLRRHARRTDTVLAPLFPGYVFVRFDVAVDQWRAINGTIGVKRLICSDGGKPQAMPDGAMAHLLSRCSNGIVGQLLDAVREGETVRVIKGPFADRLAKIEAMDTRGRVRVLLDMLGGAAPVRLELDCLAPA
jgi:transcriptional antiterminator RfaH